jgi:tight adherence protein B
MPAGTGGAASLAVLLAVLVATAVLVGAAPGGAARRRLGRLRALAEARGGGVPSARSRPWRRLADPDPATLLGEVVTAVAAEVRAGRAPADAWRLVLGAPVGPDGVPGVEDVLAAVLPPRRRPSADDPAADPVRRRVAGVLAAGRLAAELGAPTAGVLEECARALAADADAETAVRGALAGPRQTTTLLTWLPVLGVALGTLLGADPLGTLLGGGAGTAAGVGGLVLTLLGRRWTGRMVADARSAGERRDRGGGSEPEAGSGRGSATAGRAASAVGSGWGTGAGTGHARGRAAGVRAGGAGGAGTAGAGAGGAGGRAPRGRACAVGEVLLVLLTAAAVRLLRPPPARHPREVGDRGAAPRRGDAGDEAGAGAVDLVTVVDLLAVAVGAGASVPGALAAVGAALGGRDGADLARAGAALLLGEPWDAAWAHAPAVGGVLDGLEAAWRTGAPAGPALRAAAAGLRRSRERAAREAAGRLGVRLVVPLGLCFLPAFVLVGLVPVLASLGRGLF